MKRFYQLLTLGFTWLFVLSAQAQLPVAYYSFSGGAQDLNGNHASIHGAQLTADRFGQANSAFFLDGQQAFLEAPNSSALNSDYATVAFWAKPASIPGQGEVYLISFGGWQERYKISLPAHGKCIWTTNNSSGISDMDAGAGNELTVGVWKHLTFVHDGTKDRIYVNGVKVAEKNVSGTLNSTTKPLGIGFDAVDRGNFFHGAIDEVAIFDVALNDVQIAAAYALQSSPPTVPPGVVASYSFSGNTLDGSALANHAQAENVRATTDRFGFGSSAYYFNGTNAGVTAANSSPLNSAKTTISFWVKPNSFPGSGEAYILSNGGWQERWKISLPSHGKPVFTTHPGFCCSDMDSGTPLTLDAWTHVVMVHDGTQDVIYFNGVQVNAKNVSGALDATVHPLGIGYDPIDNANFFDGAVDEVQIYNYGFSAAEVAALYAQQSAFPGTPGDVVAAYSMNGNGEDDSQYGNDADTEGAVVTADRFNLANNALELDGTSGILAENSPALQSDYLTVAFWIKPTEFPGSGEVYLISNGGWQERFKISMPSHGKPVFTTHSNGQCCSDMDSGTPLTLNAWTHVTMVHDGTQDIIYFNGNPVNQKNVSGALDKTQHPLGIGYDPIDNGSYFKGALDEVIVVNRALSAAEIAALFALQSQQPSAPTALIADYPFSGNALDNTIFENHAQVIGAQLADDRFGKKNQAYETGQGKSLVAANSPQQNSANTTISFWIKPNSLPGSGEVYVLSNGGWQERWKISLPSHGKPVFTTHPGFCCSDMDSGTPLTVGAWTHVAMVHDGSKDIIYFNGSRVNEKNVSGALDATTKPLGIGFDPIDNNYFFDGSLDEVQIYNAALSDAEIAALYAAQSTPVAGGDATAPSSPLNLSADVLYTNVTLSWLASTDNVGVAGYNVYQNGAKIATTGATSIALSGLPQLTTFSFGVSAVDAAGNESAVSYLSVTTGEEETPDVTPPTAPGNLTASVGANSALLSWEASTDDRGVKGYVVFLDGTLVDTLPATQTSIFIGGLDAETPYTLEVYAFDNAGNNSEIAALDITTDEEIDTGETGLVAHYPFEGNANDATPYLNHGVPGGDVSYINANHPNGGALAVKFDGQADSILAPNAVQLISDYTTVAFWIRVDGQNPADPESYILDFGHWDQRWKISLPQHKKIVWTTNSNNTQFPVFISDMDSGDGNEMVPGFWWHVVMTHDGVNDKIYVNGQLANTKPAAGKLNSTGRPLGMGGNPIDGGQYFNGALDELKIYNKALTGGEAEHLFNTGTSGTQDANAALLNTLIQDVFPNPATDVMWVKHSLDNSQPLLLRVFDEQGRQIDAIRYDSNEIPAGVFSVKTGSYPAGKYYLNFVIGEYSIGSVKFQKQ